MQDSARRARRRGAARRIALRRRSPCERGLCLPVAEGSRFIRLRINRVISPSCT